MKYTKISFLCTFALLLGAQAVSAHGTVTSPPSRVWRCFQEGPESPRSPACIGAVSSYGTQALYDWNEINQATASGNHQAIIPDGTLASGGRPEKYGGMDQVRADWTAEQVSPGPYTVTWTNTAAHATAYFDVYITNADWNPSQPLTWGSLTRLVRTAPSAAERTVNIPVTLPARTGKHVIYSVWQRSDSGEAFYSASDVDFGGGGSPVPTPTPVPTPPTTSTSWGEWVSYQVGDVVTANGLTYRCLQSHTSQPDWFPSVVPALWQQL